MFDDDDLEGVTPPQDDPGGDISAMPARRWVWPDLFWWLR